MHTNPDCPKGSDVQKEASPASRCLHHLAHHPLSFLLPSDSLTCSSYIPNRDDAEHTGGQSTHLDPHKWQTSFCHRGKQQTIEDRRRVVFGYGAIEIHIYNRKTQSPSR
jgi:hypothetical protein